MASTVSRPNKAKPLGAALDLSDAELEQLAQVAPMDIETAKARWKAVAAPLYKNLLDAEKVIHAPQEFT